ncbi:MAG TPA: FN3 domain-containing metallophosphoesterase family protein [Saprospiraceae bacterium]|nr:FN3 domain-containing metallophosphoesterase family protein [Saprospiraceae bacterium]
MLVNPYLQLSLPTSIHIMWETNTNNESIIQYGTSEDLGSSVSGTAFNSLGGTVHHDVLIDGLQPGTRYYYQALTGEWKSAIWHFVTPMEREDEENFNIVLMSDMQIDGGNPNIFSDLVNTSLLPYITDTYGAPLDDHLQMVMIPGDVVDNGNTFSQWKNHFFNPAEVLWREVPSYPAIGNHEANSQNYFNYFQLPQNGTQGYLEHWYVHDYSNVRVLGMDSNTPYRIQAQLDWLDSILVLSCQDTLIDFVFAQMHHPFKSELWTPGETDYTGDIVARLETFSAECGKPTVHFFGHTHAYSRGESRDHQHVWLNVATAGGNIDYWGEFANADYEEFIISEDEYGFVMVEVTAGDDPQFTMRRLSFGDEYDPGGSTESDELTVRVNNNLPQTPLSLFPLSIDTVSPLCFTLKADDFIDPDGDEHGASHWQISTDSTDFDTPVVDTWKQYANWYNEVDLQANDDLTDESMSNLDPGETYWWRVRYRDKSLAWSTWTTPMRFQTGETSLLTSNLVANPGAETGITSWTIDEGTIESLSALECAGIDPYAGTKYFAVGALCVEYPFASVHQDIDVTAHVVAIDAGEVLVHYGAYLADWQNTDIPSFALQFHDGDGQVISGTDTISHQQSAWTLKQQTLAVPEDTRTIRYILMGTRTAGTDNDSYFDNIFLELLSGDFACSEYTPPGPVHGRLYVDHSANGVPNGESWLKAYRTLGDALVESNSDTSIHEIWIAEGVYPVTTNTNRDTSFIIERAVKIYGGFEGSEELLSQRIPELHPVILSGEIGDTSTTADNVYHVVLVQSIMDTVLFDGIAICCGNADSLNNTTGGGLYVSETNMQPVLLRNCVLSDNNASAGSALYNEANAILEQSIINSSGTASAILNTGPLAELTLQNTVIHHCMGCDEAVKNVGGAVMNSREGVEIKRE